MRSKVYDPNWRLKWHLWFAWCPVIVEAGTMRVTVWLEMVERKGRLVDTARGASWVYDYRLHNDARG